MEGVSVVRGRRPGASVLARPSSSQNICARVEIEKPRPGTTGLESDLARRLDVSRTPLREAMRGCVGSHLGARRFTMGARAAMVMSVSEVWTRNS